jgi:hypothetical protein
MAAAFTTHMCVYKYSLASNVIPFTLQVSIVTIRLTRFPFEFVFSIALVCLHVFKITIKLAVHLVTPSTYTRIPSEARESCSGYN